MNIRDIAKLTGVGVSIISRALNNHPDVKESTIEKRLLKIAIIYLITVLEY